MVEPGAVEPGTVDSDVAVEGTTRRSSWRRALVSGVLVAVLVAAFAWALSGQWSDIIEAVRDQDPWVLLGSLALAVAGVWMSFELWRGTLAALGSTVARRPASRLFCVAPLG